MKPALLTVVSKLRAGACPTVLEFGALLRENGLDQTEARALVGQYRDAIATRPSAEDTLMASLRSFALRHE